MSKAAHFTYCDAEVTLRGGEVKKFSFKGDRKLVARYLARRYPKLTVVKKLSSGDQAAYRSCLSYGTRITEHNLVDLKSISDADIDAAEEMNTEVLDARKLETFDETVESGELFRMMPSTSETKRPVGITQTNAKAKIAKTGSDKKKK